MFKLTLRTLSANRIRLALTTFAVVLGVSFVVASFILGDGLRNSFGSLSEDIVGTTDLEIQPHSEFGSAAPLPASIEVAVAGVEGVRTAVGQVSNDNIQPVRADGTPLTTVGPPLIGFSWVADPGLSGFTIVEGRAPEQGMEFALDQTSAAENGFVLGERYGIITPTGEVAMELVGISRFGQSNETLGAVLSQYPLATAQELFDRTDQFDWIAVSYDDGVDPATVQAAVADVLPDNATAISQQQLLTDTKADFNEGIGIFNNILLGFAGVALFVSIFIIANTFAIVLGQRTKELALLRAIGASPSQVRRSTMSEAAIVGTVASVIGVGGGIGLNYGLRYLFSAIGAGLPESDLILAPRTILIAFAVGVGVTILSAFGPARKASTVPPIAAMQDSMDAPRPSDTRRNLFGAGTMATGVALGSVGLFASMDGTAPRILALAVGAVLTFVGLALASPAVAKPIIDALGIPLRTLGAAGELSTQNASRNRRRTASTAASLMVGLALVTTALVVGESLKQSISDTLASEVKADYVSTSNAPIDPNLVQSVAASPVFASTAAYRYDQIRIDGKVAGVIGTSLVDTGKMFELGVSDGTIDAGATSVLVHEDEAERRGLAAGDTVAIDFPNGTSEIFRVGAIFGSKNIIDEDFVISTDRWEERFGPANDWWLAVKLADGVTASEANAALADLALDYPQNPFEDQTQYRESVEQEIDQMLVAINAMLVLAIIIALVGIANTLALSVFERTREIGLLRAVGMSRRQTRRMIRWEAAQVALFGSILGIGVGLVFGWGVVSALPESFVSTLGIPLGRIALLLVVCGVSGLGAAALPARRASRLNVLDAISHA